MMHFQPILLSALAAVLVAAYTGPTYGEGYDFKFLSGGGGGGVPDRVKRVQQAGAQICVDVKERRSASDNRVMFTLWSEIAHPDSRIAYVMLDTGRHVGIFSDVSIAMQAPGIKMKSQKPAPHAFLPTVNPSFAFGDPHPGGFAPGKFVMLAATLGRGKTYADVVMAMNEGVNPATATTGLRVAVIAHKMAGSEIAGSGTISSDGGFVTRGVSRRCRR